MVLSDSLNVALKEWAVVCDALTSGRQVVLLRKGGIYEAAGEFEVEHRQFLLFPTYLHQNAMMLKPDFQAGVERRVAEPGEIAISAAAEVTDVVQLHSRQQMDAIDEEHIWSAPLIDMRFNYRPQNPLYLLIMRTYRLEQATKVINTPGYAGCKSWVPLESAIVVRGAEAAMADAKFEQRRKSIIDRLGS